MNRKWFSGGLVLFTLLAGNFLFGSQAFAIGAQKAEKWKGEWLNEDFKPGGETYDYLNITAVNSRGFKYHFLSRDVPYGPNEVQSETRFASFADATHAGDLQAKKKFILVLNPKNKYARTIEVNGTRYLLKQTFFKAGFNCDKAGTPIEHAICGNELLAKGDLQLNKDYRALRKSLSRRGKRKLRSRQRSWARARDRNCQKRAKADNACLARTYANRLAALAKLKDASLGRAPRYDAAYVWGALKKNSNIAQDLPTQLAVFGRNVPLAPAPRIRRRRGLVMVEGKFNKTEVIWPSDVEFKISTLLLVERKGRVWTAIHTVPAGEFPDSIHVRIRTSLDVRGDPGLTKKDWPPALKKWVRDHPLPF
ncbi:MAG: DUF1311 domain-containing protein [SAR324 cluster bacterium]|nr:DUF1311 domain-containing protein [SAR324 cluster bacterium]